MVTCDLYWAGFDLPGRCAQWFSGSATALAVIVALAGYFIAEKRFRKEKSEQDSGELASLSVLLSDMLEEAEANFRLVSESVSELTIHGVTYEVLPLLSALDSRYIDGLDKDQTRFLFSNGFSSLCNRIRNIAAQVNINNQFLSDYGRSRHEFADFANSNFLPTVDGKSEIAKIAKAKLTQLEHDTSVLLEKTQDTAQNALSLCADFNSLEFHKVNSRIDHKVDTKYVEETLSR